MMSKPAGELMSSTTVSDASPALTSSTVDSASKVSSCGCIVWFITFVFNEEEQCWRTIHIWCEISVSELKWIYWSHLQTNTKMEVMLSPSSSALTVWFIQLPVRGQFRPPSLRVEQFVWSQVRSIHPSIGRRSTEMIHGPNQRASWPNESNQSKSCLYSPRNYKLSLDFHWMCRCDLRLSSEPPTRWRTSSPHF